MPKLYQRKAKQAAVDNSASIARAQAEAAAQS